MKEPNQTSFAKMSASFVIVASMTFPIVSAASWQLSSCASIDPHRITDSFAGKTANWPGTPIQKVTCLNENNEPVRMVFHYDQAQGRYDVSEHPLTRAERIGAFFRTRTGEYVFLTGATVALTALSSKAYSLRRARVPPIEGPAAAEALNGKSTSWFDRFSSVRIYENLATGEHEVVREFRLFGIDFKFSHSRTSSTNISEPSLDPKTYNGPIIDGEVVYSETLKP